MIVGGWLWGGGCVGGSFGEGSCGGVVVGGCVGGSLWEVRKTNQCGLLVCVSVEMKKYEI